MEPLNGTRFLTMRLVVVEDKYNLAENPRRLFHLKRYFFKVSSMLNIHNTSEIL